MSRASQLSLLALSSFNNFGQILTSRGATQVPTFSAAPYGFAKSIIPGEGIGSNRTTGNVTLSSTTTFLLNEYKIAYSLVSPSFTSSWWISPGAVAATAFGEMKPYVNNAYQPSLSAYQIVVDEECNLIFDGEVYLNYDGGTGSAIGGIVLYYSVEPNSTVFYPITSTTQSLPSLTPLGLGGGISPSQGGMLVNGWYDNSGDSWPCTTTVRVSAGTYRFRARALTGVGTTSSVTNFSMYLWPLRIYKQKLK
ncbi:MAG: hypothetical protein EBU90_25190 [Proteobacteria bacterium]|nr:hypothetical protein [Pseudomonadota bacterium]NBP16499.1 hypothetical protein [bacterium]